MPSFEVIYKYELKKGDEKAHNFIIDDNCMLYTVPNTVVCAQRSTNFWFDITKLLSNIW